MKRRVTDEERELFEATFRDAKKLAPTRKKTGTAKPKPKKSETQKPAAAGAKPDPHLFPGLDGRTSDRLRRGALEPQARLDLHGMTEAVAHRTLTTFLRAASARGLRLVIVITGKGLGAVDPYAPFDMELDMRVRGVLKTMTPRWLKEPELSRFVADVRPAHRRHGGAGALYVYLRKQRGSG